MKKILIVAPYYMDLDVNSNNRTNFIPKFLHDKGYDVEVVTTNFNHTSKKKVLADENRDYKFTMIPITGYRKNISIKRIFSVISFKRGLRKYLNSREPVDIVYSFAPPHSISNITYKYTKKVGAKYVVDIRDLWPEAFQMITKNRMINSILFYPLKLSANKTYTRADSIISVSETYKQRALSVVKRDVNTHVIYIGTSLSEFDRYKDVLDIVKPNNEVWLIYTGTISISYDLDLLLRAYKLVQEKGHNNIKLHIMGSGPNLDNIKKLDIQLGTKVNFYSRYPYPQMVSFLTKCDITINPLIKNSYGSIINKHADYAASGLPVINTQVTKEYVNMVEENKIGLNSKNGDIHDLANKIILLAENKELRTEMGRNHRLLAERIFNRDKIYDVLLDIL